MDVLSWVLHTANQVCFAVLLSVRLTCACRPWPGMGT